MDPTTHPAAAGDPRRLWSPLVRSVGILALLLGASFGSMGCVSYVPVEPEAVPPEEEVRVRFTNEGAIRAARQLGRIRTELDAGVAPMPHDSIEVVVWLGKNYPGTAFENVRETLVLPRSEVSDLHLRRLNVPRTVAALVGAGVVFSLLVDKIFLQEHPGVPPGDDENPPPAGMTLLRIPLGHTP